MIKVNYKGRLGNQLFQYSLGRLLAERTGRKLECPPLPGFPATYDKVEGYVKPLTCRFERQHIDLAIAETTSVGIILDGFFQRYDYYKNDKDKIRGWLNRDWEPADAGPDDVVVHVRRTQNKIDAVWPYVISNGQVTVEGETFPLTDRSKEVIKEGTIMAGREILPFEWYESVLAGMVFDRLFICTDMPQDPFFRLFTKYDAIIKSSDVMGDFNLMRSAGKLLVSLSTISWWAGFLSNGKVYLPKPTYSCWTGKTGVDLMVWDDPRYTIVPVKREGTFF